MRGFLGRVLLCASLALLTGAARAAQPDGTLVVTMLGDSLTAGYGLRAKDAIPARLQAALQASGLKVVVRPAVRLSPSMVTTRVPSGWSARAAPAARASNEPANSALQTMRRMDSSYLVPAYLGAGRALRTEAMERESGCTARRRRPICP